MKDGYKIIGALFSALLLTGCGGGSEASSGGDINSNIEVDGGDDSGIGADTGDGGDLGLTVEKGVLDDMTFSYSGEIKSIAVTGEAFDPMFGLANAGEAAECVGRDDRYYENGLIRVYSDGGATDDQLKSIGDAAQGTLEMAIAGIGYNKDTFMADLFSHLHPKTVNRILNDYARNGIPVVVGSDGNGGREIEIWAMHELSFHLDLNLSDEEKAMFANGQHESYRDAVSEVILTADRNLRETILEQVQYAFVRYEYDDPNAGVLYQYVDNFSPAWEGSSEQAYMEENYPDLFVDAMVDEVFNVCVLTEGNIPSGFESENGINAVVVSEDISNTDLGVAMAKEVNKHLATTYRYDYFTGMPEWFEEGVAYSLLDRNIAKPTADLLSEAGIPEAAAENDKLNAALVMAMEGVNNDLFMAELYLNQRLVTYDDSDASEDGFKAVFDALVTAPGYPNLTYVEFVNNFDSIMADIL
ncbi:hypothetical protein [Marinobacter sp. F4216]|uniref:hypothetical protein n=1 Tax=Marinobacter sp. F4216 TaxID=2874281 RepID=UPI001CBACBD9|nr:hypothetical protein [Marinobacter sp. F4216]MBZ2169463.1 hypothetical protein [Marinobacter sp. F4216]